MGSVQLVLVRPFCHWYYTCVARGLWPACPGAIKKWCLEGKE